MEPEGHVRGGGVAVTTDERDAVCKRYGVQVHTELSAGDWYTSAKEYIFFCRNPTSITPSEFENLVLTRVMEEIFVP